MKHILLSLSFSVLASTSYSQVNYVSLHDNTTFNQRNITLHPIGSTAGAAGVSATGAATYSIPIWCPPGTHGMQPGIALSYSSQGGNGIMGMGWSLSGLSAVTRVAKNLYHDGEVAPVSYTMSDRFALDGVRLLYKSGTYGAANAEYAPEAEDFSHVVSYGTKGNGPESFFVTKKDGTLLQYGNTTDSRFLTNDGNHVMMWCVNKIMDMNGNFIEFAYNFSDRMPRIQEIRYTGNIYTGLNPYNKITFEYAERTDKNTVYEGGFDIFNSLLLTKVKVYDENNIVQKTYELTYGNDGINSYLKEITEKNKNGDELNSTQFKYGEASNNIVSTAITGLPGPASSSSLIPESVSGDFNGDGISEMLVIERENHAQLGVINTGFSIYYKNSLNGFVQSVTVPYPAPTFVKVRKRIGHKGEDNSLAKADFNGDGLEDVIVSKINISASGGRYILDDIRIYYGDKDNILNVANPQVIIPTINWDGQNINVCELSVSDHESILIGDFDGNCKSDLFVLCEGNGLIDYPFIYEEGITPAAVTGIDFSQITHSFEMRLMDFDGDGKNDIMFLNQNSCFVYSFSKQSNGTYVANLLLNSAGYPNLWHKVWTGDFNGDGKTDVLTFVGGYNWSWGISTGKTFEQTFLPVITEAYSDECHYDCNGGFHKGNTRGDDIVIADYNGDGRSDIMFSKVSCPCSGSSHTENTEIELFLAKNNSIEKVNTFSNSNVIPPQTITVADIYGTGKPQLMFRFANTSDFTNLHITGTEYPLLEVADGLGNVNMFGYEPLTTSTNYTKGTNAQYPLVDVKAPLYVAAYHQAPNGLGTHNITYYNYKEAVVHAGGRGFLGFKTVLSETPVLKTKTEVISDIDPIYYAPYVKEINTYSTSPLQQIAHTANNISFVQGSVPGSFYQQLLGQTESNLLTGSTATIANTYDNTNFGTIVTSAANINNIETVTTTTTYTQPGSVTVPCMPELVTVTRQRTGQPATTDKTFFSYDWAGRVYQKTDRYQTIANITYTFQYDDFGNLTQKDKFNIVLSGGNPHTITHTYNYEPVKGRFLESAVNPIGQTSYATWSPVWGKPLTATGIDGIVTANTYDDWGKLTSTKIKAGTAAEETITYTDGWDISGNQLFYTLAGHPAKPDVKTWYDRLGREVKTQTEHLNGQWTERTKTYNAKGDLLTETAPRLSSESAFSTMYYYNDPYNRLTSVTNNFGTIGYSYSFLGNGEVKTTVTDPSGQVRSSMMDATGKTLKQADNGGELKYSYDSRGNLLTVYQNFILLMMHTYNSFGIKTHTYDISAGTTSYAYDAFGRLKSEKDANNHTHSYMYNELGLLTQRTGPEGTTYYTYNETGSGASNQLATVTGFNGVNEAYSYDALGRLTSKDKFINGNIYTSAYLYDNLDNVIKKSYSDGFHLMYEYDNGYLTTVKNDLPYTNHLLFHSPVLNGLGQYTQYTLGNNKVTNNTYHHGYLTRTATSGIQDLEMSYDYASGNLSYREDHLKNLKETFTYDNLNRLTQSRVGVNAPFNITYDAGTGGLTRGNIIAKTGVGTFGKGNSGKTPSALNEAGAISQNTQDITYTPFRKTATVAENGYEQAFTYDAGYGRVTTTVNNGGNPELQRIYVDDYEITTDYLTGEERMIHYLGGGDGLLGIAEIDPNSQYGFPYNITYHYVYTDHLGSIVAATDAAGNVEAEQSFDAWGRVRNPQTWDYAGAAGVGLTHSWLYRGYTGHEHMPQFSIINMNGRTYDPVLGRMMSPDPYLMGGTQGYNRYSYCLNNPLKYTDPTGEWVHIVVGAVVGGAINLAMNWNNIDNFGEGLAVFAIGAGSGALTAATGGASLGVQLGVAAGTAAATSATNNVVAQTGNGVGLNQVNWGQVGMNAGVGAVAGVAGYGAGQWASSNLSTPLIGSLGVNSPVVAGAINGAVGGAVGGAAGGFVAGGIMGGSLDAALQGAWNGFKSGGVVGGGAGAASGYFSALASGRNPWTGKSNSTKIYRAVSLEEYKDIQLNGLRPKDGQYEGKLFYPTYDEAVQGSQMFQNQYGQQSIIIEVTVPNNATMNFYHFQADGMNAIFINVQQLQNMKSNVIIKPLR